MRVEPPPSEVLEKGGDYIRGVAKLDDRLVEIDVKERGPTFEVSTAAGMARHGLLPVVNSFAAFLALGLLVVGLGNGVAVDSPKFVPGRAVDAPANVRREEDHETDDGDRDDDPPQDARMFAYCSEHKLKIERAPYRAPSSRVKRKKTLD